MKIKLLMIFSIALIFMNVYAAEQDQSASMIISTTKEKQYNDYDEVVFEHIKRNETKDRKISTAQEIKNAYASTDKTVAQSTKNNKQGISGKKNSKKQNKNSSNNNHKFFLTGYCYGGKSIEVSRLSSYTYLRCNFQNVNAKLAVMLIPDAFSRALIGKPLYVMVNGKRYNVLGGVILNADRTSLNLAQIVNDRKIETFLADTGISGADIATKTAQAYLDAENAANTSETASYVSNTSTTNTITTKTTNPPKSSYYLASAGIQFVSAMVKAGSEIFKEDLPFLFKTKDNEMYYADIVVTDLYPQLPSVNINRSSITANPTLPTSKKQSVINLTSEKKMK